MIQFLLRDISLSDYSAVIALWNSAPGVRTSESPEEFARILRGIRDWDASPRS